MNWRHKDIWTYTDCKTYTVEVSRHEAAMYDRGPHRWCVYAYVYPDHPYFSRFDLSEGMMQEAAQSMPFHGGPLATATFLRVHRDNDGSVTSVQIGADYDHMDDHRYTHYETKDQAWHVFTDAEHLVRWLEEQKEEIPA